MQTIGDIEKEVISNTFNVEFLLDFIVLFFRFSIQQKVLHVESRKINPSCWSKGRWKWVHFTFHQFHITAMCLLGIKAAKNFKNLILKCPHMELKGKMLKLHRFSYDGRYLVTCNAPKWITSAFRNPRKSLKNQRFKISHKNRLNVFKKNFHPINELNY